MNSPHTEIAAVCKPDTEGALARARSWGIEPEKVYADWRDCLADDSIDAFEVLLPHHMHMEVALAAIETGKHLSTQKPVGFTVAECSRFVEAAAKAEQRGQVVRVFENFLFYPPVARMVDIVRSGEIGEVLSVRQISRSGNPDCGWDVPDRAAAWRFDIEQNGGGPLVFDDGLHKFSIFWALLGVADEVHAWIGSTPVEGGALDSPSAVTHALGLGGHGRARGGQRAGAAGAVAVLLAGRPGRGHRLQGRGLGEPRPRQDPGGALATGLPRWRHP